MSENKKHSSANGKLEDVASIKKDEQKTKTLILFGLLAVVAVIGVGLLLVRNSSDSKQDYIGGNVIRMSNTVGSREEDIIIGNPWRNASLVETIMFRSLFETDNTFTDINPSLAENLQITNNGATYVFTMRENQFWSDGEPITVDDVLFSFDAFLKCTSVNSNLSLALHRIVGATDYANGEADTISGITSNGNDITIELQSPISNFALWLTQFVPLPEHILGEEEYATLTDDHSFFKNTNSVSSGEFYAESIDEQNNLVLAKNEFYTDNSTDIDNIIICWDYENEVIDYFATSDPAQMVSNRSMKGFVEHPIDVYFYRYFIFNLAGGDEGEPNTAMHDEKVRQAIYHAIDTELLMEEIYFNKTNPVYGGSMELSQKLYDYDPEKSKQLLEEADYDFERTFTVAFYSGDSSTAAMLEKIDEQLSAVGLNVELFQASAAELYTNPTYDMLLKNLSALNTEDWYSEYLSTNANLSQLLGRNGEFDDLINELTAQVDPEEYNKIMLELVELEQELLYKLPLFLLSDAIFINSNRLHVPDDIVFGNTRYRSDIRLDEWYVIKE